MRFRFALALIFLVVSRAGFASAIVFSASDEGAMDYGLLRAVDIGHEVFASVDVTFDNGDWRTISSGGGTRYIGESGPLTSLTLTRNASGAVVQSRYEYDGGIFEMHFDLYDDEADHSVSGDFVAPIIGLMTVTVSEHDELLGDRATVSYRLGPGLFDESVATLLGVRRQTIGGLIEDPFLTFGTGDYTTLWRRLDEGGAMVRIDVPEPTSVLLASASGLGLLLWQRRNKRRHRSDTRTI
jgi:hypothetical protein